jgi:pimeloyl-ACP methyl ester carboxylesterase
MRRRVQRQSLVVVPLLALVLAGRAPSPAAATLSFTPCPNAAGFSCASLGVPLDRSGVVTGTISLSVERKLAGRTPSSTALVALAGGPGQAALPFASYTARTMAAALKSRDLLMFDQRGTGDSDPLSCPALEDPSTASPGRLFERCAAQLGPARRAFTTAESVQDIESLRRAGGYEKLLLYGTSYGTKVALEYAERYPQHVEALLLDSVVPTDGPEPLSIPTLEAVSPIIRELCSQQLCRGITNDALADLSRLILRLRRAPLSGTVYDGLGERHHTTISEVGLLGVLEAGDLNPALRALLPAAVRSALDDDPDPLVRLEALSEGLIPNLPSGEIRYAGGDETDEALFATTSCEEEPFPWQRDAGAAQRLAEARAFAEAQPAADFAPFDAATAFGADLVSACAYWPDASPPPPAPSPLPDVPTLILSGAQDMRTPTPNARRVAALIPDAQVEVVPFTGHSVIGSDLTGCAARALSQFFAGTPVQPCTSHTDVLRPTPVTPTRIADVRAPSGLPGLPGKTLVAVNETLVDLDRQVIAATLQVDEQLPNGASFGGLRGGYARIGAASLTLHRLAFVSGVQLTATFRIRNRRLLPATIQVTGPGAATGTVVLGSVSKRVSGVLGGRSFSLTLAGVRVAGAGSAEWPGAAELLSHLGHLPGAGPPARLP